MGWVAVLGYTVLVLAVGRLTWWLFSYIAGDVREIVRHRVQRLSRHGLYKPNISVLVYVTDADASLLEGCLHSVLTGTQQPARVTVLADGGTAYDTAVSYRSRYKAVQLRVVRRSGPIRTPVELRSVFRAHGRGSLGVLLHASHRLDTGALYDGMQQFRDRQLAMLEVPVIVQPDNSLLRAVLCVRQVIARHIARSRTVKSAVLAHHAVFFRRNAFRDTQPARTVYAPSVYVREQARKPLRTFVRSHAGGTWAPVWVCIELAAVGTVLYTYGTSRGMFLLLFPAGLALLLAAVAIWSRKGMSVADRVSLFLLVPFAWMGYIAGGFLGAAYRVSRRGRVARQHGAQVAWRP